MRKSQSDIDAQVERIMVMAEQSQRFRGVHNKVARQTILHLARTAKAQHGFSLFDADKDTKRECIRPYTNRMTTHKMWWQQDEWINRKPYEPRKRKESSPITAEQKLALEVEMNNLCNHQMMAKVLAWVATDITLKTKLGLPGDPFDVPRMLMIEMKRIMPQPKQLKIQFE